MTVCIWKLTWLGILLQSCGDHEVEEQPRGGQSAGGRPSQGEHQTAATIHSEHGVIIDGTEQGVGPVTQVCRECTADR